MHSGKFTRLIICVAGIVGYAVSGCASLGASDAAVPDGTVLAAFEVPISDSPSLLIVPVEIEDRRYPFVIDTGSSLTLYDRSLKSLLGEPVESLPARTGSGRTTVDIHSAPEARLGPLPLDTGGRVGCMDLRPVRDAIYDATGRDIAGIIGMDFLRRQILRIECARGQVELLDAASEPRPEWGTALPIEYWGKGVPAVAAILPDGQSASFLLDTGDASIGDLQEELFDRLAEQGALARAGEVVCATGSGFRTAPEGVLDRFGLGPFQDERLRFYRSHWNGLGIGYLARYTVTFDFPRDRVYFSPHGE